MTDEPPTRLESLEGDEDGRRYSPSAGCNRQEIVDALVRELPDRGVCLEVAAGTGEHAVLAATRLPGWDWLPTDRDPEALASIRAWVAHAALPNLKAPVPLDLCGSGPNSSSPNSSWPCAKNSLDAVFASNVMHISPIAVTKALFHGAAAHLGPTGVLLVYGAVFLPGEPQPHSNIAFDRELRARDPAFGVRTLSELGELATSAGLAAPAVRRMSKNNVLLRFDRA